MPFALETCPEGWEVYEQARGRMVAGRKQGQSLGAFGGRETVTLTTQEMPPHKHEEQVASGVGNPFVLWGTGPTRNAMVGYTWAAHPTLYTNSAGNGQPFSILPPYIALLYCKKT